MSISRFAMVAIAASGLFLAGCQTTSSTKTAKPAGGKVQSMVKASARAHGVPVCLALAVSHQESGHRCNAVGAAGELGPLQIKYQSARGLGYKGTKAQLRNSCSLKIKWGMVHLKRGLSKGGTHWKAAYHHNAGIYAKSYRNGMAKRYANSVSGKVKRCGR